MTRNQGSYGQGPLPRILKRRELKKSWINEAIDAGYGSRLANGHQSNPSRETLAKVVAWIEERRPDIPLDEDELRGLILWQ